MKNIGLIMAYKNDNSMGVLHHKPHFMHALQAFIDNKRINFLIVVAPPDIMDSVEKITYRITEKPLELVMGDDSYLIALYNAMQYMGTFASYMCKVMIHDGNRPYVTNALIENSMDILESYDAGVCALGAEGSDTLTPDNMDGVTLQSPHSFRYEALQEVFEDFDPAIDIYTDTIHMLWKKCAFMDVGVVRGDTKNIQV